MWDLRRMRHTVILMLWRLRMIHRMLKISVEIEGCVSDNAELVNYPPDLAKKFLDMCCNYCQVLATLDSF